MIPSKLKIDLSPLWQENHGCFTIRFLDLPEEKRQFLAKRIKETAPYRTIRKTTGPSIAEIDIALQEINPVIFSENLNTWATKTKMTQCFGYNETYSISGWAYRSLCKAIYKITCRKRELRNPEIEKIAFLTCPSWDRISEFLNNALRAVETLGPQNQVRLTPPEEIGLEEMTRIRRTTERNNPDLTADIIQNAINHIYNEQPHRMRVVPTDPFAIAGEDTFIPTWIFDQPNAPTAN